MQTETDFYHQHDYADDQLSYCNSQSQNQLCNGQKNEYMVATGKKLASIFYLMVERKVEYDEKVYNDHRKVKLQNKVTYLKKRLERMNLELANCE